MAPALSASPAPSTLLYFGPRPKTVTSIDEIRAVAEPVATKGGGFKRHPIKALTGAKVRCVYLLADMKSALRGQ